MLWMAVTADRFELPLCPNCGEYYEVDYDDYDYCPKCGQKIDWSEVENGREES